MVGKRERGGVLMRRGWRKDHMKTLGAERAKSILKYQYLGNFGWEIARLAYVLE